MPENGLNPPLLILISGASITGKSMIGKFLEKIIDPSLIEESSDESEDEEEDHFASKLHTFEKDYDPDEAPR